MNSYTIRLYFWLFRMNTLTWLTKTFVPHKVDVGHSLGKYVEFSILITRALIDVQKELSEFFKHSSHPLITH
jgi:hypothetical protein